MPDLFATLDALKIPFERHDHAPVFTCDEAFAALPGHDSVQTKNIFLRDKRGRRHLLLVTTCEKAVDIKDFTEQADADRLSFGSPERLMKYLGVTPGSVTVLGLIHDETLGVELYVDRDVWNAPLWRCHPLTNTATLIMARTDLERFFEHTGHTPRVVDLRERAA
ncbi:MAG TPA: prolyl-tRNA synthetase associated domain-containing protein [Gemmatimonadaceae bacterium]|nr:prolyl-tRNA synthetase associated domain-containing protein [Gemmatimonadaceae bacterium]